MISPEKKEELIKAIREYGEAEVEFGKEVENYQGGVEAAVNVVGQTFEKVVTLIHSL